MSRLEPVAVLWDMDGTIVDSEEHWITAAAEIAREAHGDGSREDHRDMVGMSLPDMARIVRASGLELTEDEIIDRQITAVIAAVADQGLDWRPGAREMLARLVHHQIPLAMVTMSYHRFADEVVARLPVETFRAVVAGDDVEHGKPHPEAYLRAASQLGVDISRCLVVEDSPIGLAAARAAGARTLGVTCYVDLAPGSADAIWPTLEGRTLGDLVAVGDG